MVFDGRDHGLMGNSLLDVIVFGRNAGQEAGKQFKNVTLSDLTLEHVDSFEKECEAAGIHAMRYLRRSYQITEEKSNSIK